MLLEASSYTADTAVTIFKESLSLFHRKSSPETNIPVSHKPMDSTKRSQKCFYMAIYIYIYIAANIWTKISIEIVLLYDVNTFQYIIRLIPSWHNQKRDNFIYQSCRVTKKPFNSQGQKWLVHTHTHTLMKWKENKSRRKISVFYCKTIL